MKKHLKVLSWAFALIFLLGISSESFAQQRALSPSGYLPSVVSSTVDDFTTTLTSISDSEIMVEFNFTNAITSEIEEALEDAVTRAEFDWVDGEPSIGDTNVNFYISKSTRMSFVYNLFYYRGIIINKGELEVIN